MADHFYVTLPSNSSTAVFGPQPPHNFKTKLAKPIRLDPSQWEVGLAEISYPKSVINLKDDLLIKLYAPVNVQPNEYTARLEQGNYDDAQQLVNQVEKSIRAAVGYELRHHFRLEYMDDKRCLVRLHRGCAMVLPAELGQMLGFRTNLRLHLSNYRDVASRVSASDMRYMTNVDRELHISDMTVYVRRAVHSLYVYCDIISYQIVGDSMAPLLRAVTVSGAEEAEVISHIFNKVHYLALERSVYETIEIHIADDTGTDIAFNHGHVIVKLHFRKKRRY